MSIYEIGWFVFGAGVGSLSAMFLTGMYMVREFERKEAFKNEMRRRYSNAN